MPPLVVPSGALLRLIWTVGGTATAINVIGLRKTGAIVIDQALANSVGGTVKGAFTSAGQAAAHPPAVALASVGLRDISAPFNPEFVDAGAPVPGTAGTGLLPPQVAYCVTLRTAMAGKKKRGRTYLPLYAQDSNDVNGVATVATSTRAVAFLNALRTGLPAHGLSLAVVSRADLSTELVTLVQGRDLVWDTIRGRATAGI